ncbi:MAG: lipoyl(octanoyl) transferase LipB [Solirubrobacteraceae bacterium MAG38_C4-C5]|nr:lipoyl(octanoyl) transferase LipB [Candidatus Siliceabacter maunaloa]
MVATPDLWTVHLRTVEYRAGVALQERVRAARQAGAIPDVLLLLEHWPVYTRGKRTADGELPMGRDRYVLRGVDVVDTDRGGRATYHGPGQLVGYPIMGVGDVLDHVRALEGGLVAALAQEGVAARGRVDDGADFTGVWVAERKIASVGLRVARGVSMHGFAVNVQNDLQPFEWIVPCGLDGVSMTSLLEETGRSGHPLRCFRRRAAFQVAAALGRRQRLVSPARLERALEAAEREGAAGALPAPSPAARQGSAPAR